MAESSTLFIDEGAGLVPIVTIRHGHIDQVDAMRAVARGAIRAEIHSGGLLYGIGRVSEKSTQYYYKTSAAGPVFGPLSELPTIIARLEARPDRGY